MFLVAALAFLRVAAAGGHSVMWADDGVFLDHALNGNVWESATYAHHGYLNLAASLTATVLGAVPLGAVPVAYIAVASIGVGVIAWWVAAMSRSMLDSWWSQAVLGASVALIPIAGYESTGSIANLQWPIMVGALFALVGDIRTRGELVGATGFVLLASLSAPSAIMLAPLIWWRRSRPTLVAAWLIGTAAQAAAVLSAWGEREAGGNWFDFEYMLLSFAGASFNGITSGDYGGFLTWNPLSVVFAVAIMFAVYRNAGRFRLAAVLGGAAALQWWFTYSGGLVPVVPRYVIVPSICVLAVVLVAVERHRYVHIATLAVIGACWVGAFTAADYRTEGPSWRSQLDTVECVDGHKVVGLAPVDWGTVSVPC